MPIQTLPPRNLPHDVAMNSGYLKPPSAASKWAEVGADADLAPIDQKSLDDAVTYDHEIDDTQPHLQKRDVPTSFSDFSGVLDDSPWIEISDDVPEAPPSFRADQYSWGGQQPHAVAQMGHVFGRPANLPQRVRVDVLNPSLAVAGRPLRTARSHEFMSEQSNRYEHVAKGGGYGVEHRKTGAVEFKRESPDRAYQTFYTERYSSTPRESFDTYATHEVLVNGHSLKILTPKEPNPQVFTPTKEQIAESLSALPPEKLQHVHQVIISSKTGSTGYVSKSSPHDIVIMADRSAIKQHQLDGLLAHESAHVWANAMARNHLFPGSKEGEPIQVDMSHSKEWNDAMAHDIRSPSKYAKESKLNEEDFAEAETIYAATKGTPDEAAARAKMPARYAVLDYYHSLG